MCGIAGALAPHVTTDALRAMAAALVHRGPDHRDAWCDEAAGIGLAQARLAIQDLSPAGHQPMRSASGRFVITLNGEIYNHPSLRALLEAEGAAPVWRGHSDTETLLAGFEHWGIAGTVAHAVGMFAFGVWDTAERRLTLARDRFGEKPLYYGWHGGTFLFGSELKALRTHPAFDASIDRDAVASFMRFSYIPAPASIYRSTRKVMPGTLLTVSRERPGHVVSAIYWSLRDECQRAHAVPFAGSDREAVDALETALAVSVSGQQISDVPVGAFLSGGIDSSTIVAIMQRQSSRPVRTFTIGNPGSPYDESASARAVAAHLGTDHTELSVTHDDARAIIPRLPRIYDEPFADSSQMPTVLVSELARRHVTVGLSGDAGDELFGGYNRYTQSRLFRHAPRLVRRSASRAMQALTPAAWNRLYSVMRPLLPAGRRSAVPGDHIFKLAAVLALDHDVEIYGHLVSTGGTADDLVIGGVDRTDLAAAWQALRALPHAEDRMMALDALTYLPDDILCKVDRAAMSVSLETRVPFLDHRVAALAWSLPLHLKVRDGQGKWIVRQVLDRYVPRALVDRPKSGFTVPIEAWLRGPLREWAETLLDPAAMTRQGYLNPAPIQRKWREHVSGRRNWQHFLWNVLMFQAWRDEYGG